MYQLVCGGYCIGAKIRSAVVKSQMEREFGVPLQDVSVQQELTAYGVSEVVALGEGEASIPFGRRAIVTEPLRSGYHASRVREAENDRKSSWPTSLNRANSPTTAPPE